MKLYWEKENQEAWNHVQTLSNDQLLQGLRNVLDAGDLDVDEQYVVETFFKRNNLDYKLPEAYTMKEQLDFGAHQEELMEAVY